MKPVVRWIVCEKKFQLSIEHSQLGRDFEYFTNDMKTIAWRSRLTTQQVMTVIPSHDTSWLCSLLICSQVHRFKFVSVEPLVFSNLWCTRLPPAVVISKLRKFT